MALQNLETDPFWDSINGVSLRCRKAGKAGGVPLVCVHEIGGSLESWDRVLPELGGAFDVLVFDQRGCGLSQKDANLTLSDLVADLAAVIDRHSPDAPVILTGTALGAAICIATALKYPHRVAGMVLGSPTARVADDVLKALKDRAAKIKAGGMGAVVDASLAKSYPEPLRNDATAFEQYRLRWLTNDPESFCAMSMVPAQLTSAGDLSGLTCPVQLLGATHDVIRPAENVAALARDIPNGQFKELEGGHFLNLQNPKGLAGEIVSFAKGLGLGAAA